ncbi:MAG TPA: metallophosphoesterase family protein [Methylomirabilota bacterium]|nr:metallophosphoesterase family protein [Methylomirabilota bacterium]
MHSRFRRPVILALLSTPLIGFPFMTKAVDLVLPNHFVTNDSSFGSGILRAEGYRSQSAYGAVHFPTNIGVVITELRYRPDRTFGHAFTTAIANIQFNLSTTTRNAESLSPIFANNVGNDDTVVFSGPLLLSSRFNGPPGGPKDFDIVIRLTNPFLYNPAVGNLLVEVHNFSGSSVASALSGGGASNDAASRNGGILSSGSGTADPAVEALQIVYTATNQPPPPPAPPAKLSRGPYLQSGTASNIIVRWRTSQLTNSLARFGLAPETLTWSITNEALGTDHVVALTNLSPDTKYFYAVGGTETNFASGSNYFFITAPATQRPTRIWVIGDAGTAAQPDSPFYVRDPFGMRDAYYAYTSNRYTDLFLMLGDNAYARAGFPHDDGSDSSYETNVFGTFPTMLRQTVLWSTIGNHDAVNTATYQDIFSLPQNGEAGGVPSGTELYHSFDYGNIHFVCLDSEVSANSPDSPMLTWLQQDLENNTKDWLIAYWHSPPYSWSSHDSDNAFDSAGKLVRMRENVVPILENYGVDLVLCGHSHAYERSFLLDGHYGYSSTLLPAMLKDGGSGREDDTGAYLKSTLSPAEHEGAVYVVCGSSGWVYGNAVGNRYLKHPAMFIGLDKVGSMVIDVETNRLEAKLLRSNGTIGDYFTIVKGVNPAPLSIKTTRLAGENMTIQFKTIAGQRYQVLHATQLDPSNWMPVGNVITATGATTKWTTSATGPGNHFYQVTVVQ